MDGRSLPGIGIDIGLALLVGCDLMMAVGMARRIHNAGIVAAIGKHESDVGVSQDLDFVNGSPRRDWSVIVLTAKTGA